MRDWGHAKDYVEGMWMMMQQKEAEDFVLATGKAVKVRDFVEMALKEVGIEIRWDGEGVNEKVSINLREKYWLKLMKSTFGHLK